MKIEKKLIFILASILVIAMLCSCSSEKDMGRRLNRDSFSEEFQNSEGFMEIRDDVISFYNLVEEAYVNSDKSTISSFETDTDELDRLYENITGVVDDYDRDKEDITVMLKTAIQAATINKQIAAGNLLKSMGITESQDWFIEMDQVLQEAYDTFRGNNDPDSSSESDG